MIMCCTLNALKTFILARILTRRSIFIPQLISWKIRLIEAFQKCRHLTKMNLLRNYAAGVYLSEAQNPIAHTPPPLHTVYVYSRVQWFWLFFHILRYSHPSLTPWGPKDLEIGKKNFQLHPWPAEIFDKNRKMRFFGLVSKFNFRSPVWQIFTIFSPCFIFGILNTHTKFEVSKSKTVVTREWSRQGSKFICLQNLRSKFYSPKIFF
jgi:hypothetical protein